MVLTTADAAADPEGDSEGAADGGGEGDIDADFDAGPVPSTPEASGWDGDLYVVYEGPAGADGRRAAVVVWASVWDTPDDAFEILQYLEARGESAPSVAQRSGARLVAVFARGAVKDAILEKAASRALAELETRAPSRRGP
jgi:hypothetical protein